MLQNQFPITRKLALGEATHPLRKLPYHKGEVWRDEQGFWRIDGERTFIIAVWGDDIPGVNVSVAPRESRGVRRLTGELLWGRGSAPIKAAVKLQAIPAGTEDIIRTVVRECAEDPLLFAYHLGDEPELKGVTASALAQAAEIVRDEDPYHPNVISSYRLAGLKAFAETAELNGLHPYPVFKKGAVRNEFGKVVSVMDQALAFYHAHGTPQTILYMQKGFNMGDCGSLNSRVATFDEIRTEYLLSLVLGGRGVFFFTFTNPHYPELAIGNAELVKELHALTPALLSDDGGSAAMNTDNTNIRFQVKKVGPEYWVLAASTTIGRESVTFTIPELAGRALQVWREGRTLPVSDGRFTDVFVNFDVHIYTSDRRDFGLRTLAEVEAEIAAKNAARRKPGNLAYQALEHDSLNVRASSNKWGKRRPDCTLWHVTDGVTAGKLASSPNGSTGVLAYHDGTPGVVPDWIEIEFPTPVNTSRIVVYPAENSLRDYEVQVSRNGRYRTVGSAADAQGHFQEFRFAPTGTDKVRVYVTATNGPHTKIHEIEVYR